MFGQYEISVKAVQTNGLMKRLPRLKFWYWGQPTAAEVRDILQDNLEPLTCEHVDWTLYYIIPAPRLRMSTTWGHRKIDCPRRRVAEDKNPPTMIWGNLVAHQ